MEKLKELLKAKPWLLWVGLGVLIGLVWLFVRRSSGSSAGAIVPVGTAPTPTPVSSGSDSSVGDSLLGAIESLTKQQAVFQSQMLAQQQQQNADFNSGVQGLSEAFHQASTATVTPLVTEVSGLQSQVSGIAEQVASLATSLVTPAKETGTPFSFAGYDATTGTATPTTVNIDNPYEAGIAEAKVKYATATTDEERASAHAEAERYRQAARDAGVTLDEELQSGDTIHPGATAGTTPI